MRRAGVTIAGVPQGPGGVDLSLLMRFLVEQYDASNVMVEAGPGLLGAFIEQDLVDEAYIYTAPLLLGDELAHPVHLDDLVLTIIRYAGRGLASRWFCGSLLMRHRS